MGAKLRAALLGLVLAAGISLSAVPAQAAPMTSIQRGNAALNWAESHAYGHPYIWAGTGPYGFDCSGLVVAAFAHEGITLPHNTVQMLYSGKLVRTYHPRRGDLAFFGTGHVEFVTNWWHTTFGAHDSGSRIGWIRWGGYWAPTSYWRVV